MRNHKIAILLWLFTALLVIASIIAGCMDVRRVVPVEIPEDVAAVYDLPDHVVSLETAEYYWPQWEAYVRAGTERFANRIRHARVLAGWVEDLGKVIFDAVLTDGRPDFLKIAGLLGFGGATWLTRRPGDAKREEERLRIEKEASYNAGIEAGKVAAT